MRKAGRVPHHQEHRHDRLAAAWPWRLEAEVQRLPRTRGGKLRHKVFPNTPDGFAHLSDSLNKQGVKQAHACLEATGAYGGSLATYLHGHDHYVSIVNPAAIKAYAQSHHSRTKTDRVDAALIAGLCTKRATVRRPTSNSSATSSKV